MNAHWKTVALAVASICALGGAVAIALEPAPGGPLPAITAPTSAPTPGPVAPTAAATHPVTGVPVTSFADLALPAGLFELAPVHTGENDQAHVSAATWRTASGPEELLDGIVAANATVPWQRDGDRLTARIPQAGQVRLIEIDAVSSAQAHETLVRLVDTLFLVGDPASTDGTLAPPPASTPAPAAR